MQMLAGGGAPATAIPTAGEANATVQAGTIESFLTMVTTDEWTVGMNGARIELVVGNVVNWLAEALSAQERAQLVDALENPSIVFPHPAVAAMIPEIIEALLN